MKKRKELICPLCGKAYSEPPAISRKDNSTLICADCGTRESWNIVNKVDRKKEKIHTITKCRGKSNRSL